jgi:ABC-type multidrug transport system fused ATPase/permease subunit
MRLATRNSCSSSTVAARSCRHGFSSGAVRPSGRQHVAASAAGVGRLSGAAGAASPLLPRNLQSLERRGDLLVAAAKRGKGGKPSGGASGGGSSSGGSSGGGGGGGGKYKSPGEVRDGSAYSQETRKIILSLEKIRKVSPSGKELLKNINLGMYLGAKIGILGANGAGKSTLMNILAGEDKQTGFGG